MNPLCGDHRAFYFLIQSLSIMFLSIILILIAAPLCLCAFFFVRSNRRTPFAFFRNEKSHFMRFNQDISFLDETSLRKVLDRIPRGGSLVVNAGMAAFAGESRPALLRGFLVEAENRNIAVSLENFSASDLAMLRAQKEKQ